MRKEVKSLQVKSTFKQLFEFSALPKSLGSNLSTNQILILIII